MNRLVVKSKISADGVLHLDVPVGASSANSEVNVTIEPCAANTPIPMTHEEWLEFLRRTAGSWQGEFERPSQGEYEIRDPLP